MRLPIDLRARLEDLNRRRLLSVGGSARVARLWTSILVTGSLMLLAAIFAAGYRFWYWSDLDNYLPEEPVEDDIYDVALLEAILKDYENREAKVDGVLNKERELPKSTESATTTITGGGSHVDQSARP